MSVEAQPNLPMNLYDSIADSNGRTFQPQEDANKLVPSNIPDRVGYQTNKVHFNEYLSRRADVEQLVYFVREGFSEELLSIGELMDVSKAVQSMPMYLTFRADEPIALGELPPSIIDASRMASGIMLVSGKMSEEFGYDERKSVDEIYDYANGNNPKRQRLFLDASQTEACPAPEKIVKKMITMMLEYPKPGLADFTMTDWQDIMYEDDRDGVREYAVISRLYADRLMLLGIEPTDTTAIAADPRLSQLSDQLSYALGYEE